MYSINKCLFKIKYISIAAFFHMEGELCKGHRHKICIGMIQSTYIFKTNTIDNRNGALLKKKSHHLLSSFLSISQLTGIHGTFATCLTLVHKSCQCTFTECLFLCILFESGGRLKLSSDSHSAPGRGSGSSSWIVQALRFAYSTECGKCELCTAQVSLQKPFGYSFHLTIASIHRKRGCQAVGNSSPKEKFGKMK